MRKSNVFGRISAFILVLIGGFWHNGGSLAP